jgi:hypothetical protein
MARPESREETPKKTYGRPGGPTREHTVANHMPEGVARPFTMGYFRGLVRRESNGTLYFAAGSNSAIGAPASGTALR